MKQYTVIQGPSNYYKQLEDCYSKNKNIIISTWKTEPLPNIISLSKKFNVICCDYPLSPGYCNINLQCKSTYDGLIAAKYMGATHVLKIRSDIIIPELDKFLDILSNKSKLSFLCWHFYGYATDYVVYGEIDEMLSYWDLYSTEKLDAETNLLTHLNYIKNINIDSFDESKKYIEYFLGDLIKEGIHIYWASRNNLDLISYGEEKHTYSY